MFYSLFFVTCFWAQEEDSFLSDFALSLLLGMQMLAHLNICIKHSRAMGIESQAAEKVPLPRAASLLPGTAAEADFQEHCHYQLTHSASTCLFTKKAFVFMAVLVAHVWCCSAIRPIAIRNYCMIIRNRIVVWIMWKNAFFTVLTYFVAYWHVMLPLCLFIFIAFCEMEISFLGCVLRKCLLLLLMLLQVGLEGCLNVDRFSPSFCFYQQSYLGALPSSIVVTSLDPCPLLVLCSVLHVFAFFLCYSMHSTQR